MRRAPAKPVRACTLRNWCLVSHVAFEAPLHTSHLTVFTLHTTHFTLRSSRCTLRTSHSTLFTLHTALFALHTSHFTLHTAHFTVHTSHCSLRTPNVTLHSPHFTLHSPHFTLLTSHCFLHTPNFTLHTSRPTLHTALFTPHASSNLSSSHLIPAQLFSSHLFSYVMQAFMNHFPVLLLRNCAQNHFPVLLCIAQLAQNTFQYYFVLQSLHKTLPSTTLYYKACTKHFPVLCYYKACRNYFPVLLCTTKLAESTSQYYFVLQSLHKQSTSQYYFVLQSLHKGVGNCSSKTGSRRQSDKKTILKHFLKGILKGKLPSPKLRQSADKSLSQPGCSHSNTIYNLQLQKTIVLRMQPRHQATLTQPLQCDLRRLSCKAQ